MSETFGASGASDEAMTLDGIFRLTAVRHPERLALIDPPDRSAFTDGASRALNYKQAGRAIDALACRLHVLGLPRGSVVALQFPNTVEGVLTLLAIWRAGLIAALLPLFWRRAEALRALASVGAKAFIVCGRVGATDHAELALHLAADTFTIRYVCAFGDHPPDGIVPLDDIWSDSASATPVAANAEGTAAITFDVHADGITPVARAHAELMAGGLAVTLEAGLPRPSYILATILNASFAGLASTLVPWLLTGGTLALHQPFDAAILHTQLEASSCDALILPGPLAVPLAEAAIVGAALPPSRIVAVWRAPELHAFSAAWRGGAAMTDVLAFGETGIVPIHRIGDGAPGVMKAGSRRAPSCHGRGTVVATLARTAAGTLALGGPMVPQQSVAPGLADTGYPCRADPVTGDLTLSGPRPGVVGTGGGNPLIIEAFRERAQSDQAPAA